VAIHGYDPLDSISEGNPQLLNSVAHRNVINILKSYTGFYDLFAEAIQNALDAVERRANLEGNGYKPKLWVKIDLQGKAVEVVDNGVGLNEDEFKVCFAPNVSFKKDHQLRGQKGVGATFLAYGFSYARLQTKRPGIQLAAVLRGGRHWAEDHSSKIPRPKFEEVKFEVPELSADLSGTSIEIRLGDAPGEKPKRLDWQNAISAEQWFDVLRIKSPLGGVYLNTPRFTPAVTIKVVDSQGKVSEKTSSDSSYYYPHEIPNIKVKDLGDIRKKIASIAGDPSTILKKLPDEYKKLDCIFDIWTHEQIVDSTSSLGLNSLSEEEEALIHRHSVIVYGAFVDSTTVWDEFNDNVLHLREGYRILRGGLQMATDFMVQGELITIPLTKAIGYQNNTHVIVHFTNGNPDLGRKTFQPEYHVLAEKLATQVVKALTKYRSLLRPDTGSAIVTPEKELYEWKKEQEQWRDSHGVSLGGFAPSVAILSEPQEEQDVIALFHELVGAGIIRGLNFFSAKAKDRYDGLIQLAYPDDSFRFDKEGNPLGISKSISTPYESEPKVLEYKFDLDSLVADFEKDIKFLSQVDLAVCWKASGKFSSMLELKPLLIGNGGNDRIYFGSTHAAYRLVGGNGMEFEVVILEDLINYLLQPENEEANQKVSYANA
jgi:Histidine kinase-, DNA gyrase B-, and HSP90-like ATPase